MTQLSTSLVNVGLTPNDGTGNSIRDAFITTNDNVTNLKNFLQIGPTFPSVTVDSTLTTNRFLADSAFFTSNVAIDSNVASSSSTTGALTVRGGVGIGGDLFVGDDIYGDLFQGNSLVGGSLMVTGNSALVGELSTGSLTVANNVVINGSLTVHGDVTSVTTTEFIIHDPIIEIGGGEAPDGSPAILGTDDGFNRGIQFYYFHTPALEQRIGFMGFSPSDNKFIFVSNTDVPTYGSAIFDRVEADITSTGNSTFGNIAANAITATTLTGTLQTNAQPNINSVGTLTSLTTLGDISVTNGDITLSNGNINLPAGHMIYVDGDAVALSSQAFTGGSILNSTRFLSVEDSTSATTGAVRIDGGLGVVGNVHIAGSVTTAAFDAPTLGGVLTTNVQPNITEVGTLGNLVVAGSVQSTSVSAGNIHANNNIDASVITASTGLGGLLTTPAQTNITSVGVLNGLTINGGLTTTSINSTSLTVTNPIVGNIAGSSTTVTAPAQPAITSVGTLTSLDVAGGATVQSLNAGSGDIQTTGNITTTTNVVASSLYGLLMSNTQPFITAVGALSSLDVTGTSIFHNNMSVNGNVTATGTITAAHFVGDFTGASSTIAGQANSATITATSANVPNEIVLRDALGNFVANTITANLVGSSTTVTAAAQPTITSVGTLSGLTVTSPIVGSVTGSAATAATVTAAAQPTITSVGTLTSLSVTGNVTANAFVGSGAGLTNIPSSAIVGGIGGNVTIGTTTIALNGSATSLTGLTSVAATTLTGSLTGNSAGTHTGPVVGNVTGNVSGSSATASTVTSAAQPAITSVGTLTSLSVTGGVTAGSFTGSGSGLTAIPNSATTATSANTASTIVARDASGNFSAGVMTATATAARYADLAEMYQSDAQYDSGTVLVFGGQYEVTTTGFQADVSVAGVVSTAPAYLMNIDAKRAVAVALRGKVPVKVIGPVRKGDLLVTSYVPGYAISVGKDGSNGVAVFAKSLEENLAEGQKLINAVVI